MGILDGKTILVTGIFTERSIAYAAAQLAQHEGATLIFTGFGRRSKINQKIVGRLPQPGPFLELDATNQDDLDSLHTRLKEHTDSLDGIIHCISASKPEAVGDGFMTAGWDDLSTSLQISG